MKICPTFFTYTRVYTVVDFSKAFDTVDHSQLIGKLRQFDLSVCVLKWIVCFLTDRSQCIKLGSVLPACQPINRSIVQGSGIGPSLFSVFFMT